MPQNQTKFQTLWSRKLQA